MASLQDRMDAAVQSKLREQLERERAAPPATRFAPARTSAPGWHPGTALLGKEQAHQWLLPWMFGALFIIGVLTAARGWQQVEHAAVSASWPYTRGLIVSSEV